MRNIETSHPVSCHCEEEAKVGRGAWADIQEVPRLVVVTCASRTLFQGKDDKTNEGRRILLCGRCL